MSTESGEPRAVGSRAAGATGRRVPTPAITVAAVGVWVLSAAYMAHFGDSWHLDLRVYRDAAHSLTHGGHPFTEYYTASHLPYTYTPFALAAMVPLSLGPLGLAEWLWWALGAASLVWVLYLVSGETLAWDRGRRLAVAALVAGVSTLALEPVRSNLDYGQINLVLMAMITTDLLAVRGRGRGGLIGLATAVKLTPAVFAGWFLVRRRWRALVTAVAVAAAVTGLGWLVMPSASTTYWLHEVTDASRVGPVANVSNQSWNGLLHRAPFSGGAGTGAAWAVLAVATLALGLVLCGLVLARGGRADAVLVLALTELLASPVSWSHHWSWLAVAPFVAVGLWPVHRTVAVLLCVLTAVGGAAPYLWAGHGPVRFVAANSLVLSGAVVLVAWLAAEIRGVVANGGPFVTMTLRTAAGGRRSPVVDAPDGAGGERSDTGGDQPTDGQRPRRSITPDAVAPHGHRCRSDADRSP